VSQYISDDHYDAHKLLLATTVLFQGGLNNFVRRDM